MKFFLRIGLGAGLALGAAFFLKSLIGRSTVALFNPQGPVAAGEREVIIGLVLLMLLLAVPMLALLFTFAWRYRAGNPGARYEPEPAKNPGAELLLWIIPAALVAVLAVINWKSAHALDPYKPLPSANPPLTIEVVALPWKWLFLYPGQGIATVNFLEFPARTPVHFKLTADGPMSSFWIPELGSQIYAMSAMATSLNLMADAPGDFSGKDTEINGAGYAGMTFTAKAVSPAEFDAWVNASRGKPHILGWTEYQALAAPSAYTPAATYSFFDPVLFDRIISTYAAPPAGAGGAAAPGMAM